MRLNVASSRRCLGIDSAEGGKVKRSEGLNSIYYGAALSRSQNGAELANIEKFGPVRFGVSNVDGFNTSTSALPVPQIKPLHRTASDCASTLFFRELILSHSMHIT